LRRGFRVDVDVCVPCGGEARVLGFVTEPQAIRGTRRACKFLLFAVHNTPNANSVSVAELALGLMLAFERHVAKASADLRDGR
jgi:hypothetical protein